MCFPVSTSELQNLGVAIQESLFKASQVILMHSLEWERIFSWCSGGSERQFIHGPTVNQYGEGLEDA